MKKHEIEENFHEPRSFDRRYTYESLFDHTKVSEAFTWASVGLGKFFESYCVHNFNEKRAKIDILKVFACAAEN